MYADWGAANAFCKWARTRGLTEVNFTEAIELPKAGRGHLPWTDKQLAIGDSTFTGMIRKGFMLYRYTGLRGSDVVRGWDQPSSTQSIAQ